MYRLLRNYPQETKEAKKERLNEQAVAKREGKKTKTGSKPHLLKFGINQVTTLVESNEAKLVVIAADVDPIELVCWLPELCRATETPFCIVKSKAVLGSFIGQKKTAAIALTSVRKEDQHTLEQLSSNFKAQFNDNTEISTKFGKKMMGIKSRQKQAADERRNEREILRKAGK